MVQIRTLQALPPELGVVLGVHKRGPDGLADAAEPFNRTDVAASQLPMRRFLVGGSSLKAVVIAYEQVGLSDSIHAQGFVLERAGWSRVREWTLAQAPHSLFGLLEEILPPDSVWVNGRPLSAARRPGYRTWTHPERRDGPLRSDNISDSEVREIQVAVLTALPGSIVNISGVVTGCPCEDGAACTDQVWIVAHRPGLTKGLQLSRIGARWMIGPLQQWWLDFEKLHSPEARAGATSVSAYAKALDSLEDRFPRCAAATRVVAD